MNPPSGGFCLGFWEFQLGWLAEVVRATRSPVTLLPLPSAALLYPLIMSDWGEYHSRERFSSSGLKH